ncbi:cytochrome P450 [Vararia minispora EC-137]|uniref:Cytochrome P450 n=1 Tax=Vararia minispora EC-137 TaxID=1314806 RepID=A0ACB8QWV4_9AGAM|nr:cytochrome P450 [Vararia minispora EC-137]
MVILSFVFSNLWVFSGTALALYFGASAYYQLFLSPLRHIPGPWYAAVSELWIITHVLRFRQCRAVQELFEKYGPIVRYAPNKVAYCDAVSNGRIYMNTRFEKSQFYKSLLWRVNESDHAMTSLPHAEHAPRRRAFAPHYTPSNIALFQPDIHKSVLELVEILEVVNGEKPINCLHYFREMLVDIICSTSFSYNSGALQARAAGVEYHPLVHAIDDFPIRGILRAVVPKSMWELLGEIPHQRWKLLYDSDAILAKFVGARVKHMRAQMQDGKLQEVEKVPLVQRLLEYRLPSGEPMEEKNIIAEHLGHFIAGVDTTATTISYALWELSRRPDIARRLRAEVDSAMHDPKTIPDISVLNSLSFLTAVIKETLRVYGAVPSLLERVVPSEGIDLLGCNIPSGTVITTQSWSLHRKVDVFPSPNTYLPDRWVDADPDNLREMEAHMMPFGIGQRVCVGQHFAYQSLRIVLAVIARNFDIYVPPETSDRSMEVRDAFVAFPASGCCCLVLTPRKS